MEDWDDALHSLSPCVSKGARSVTRCGSSTVTVPTMFSRFAHVSVRRVVNHLVKGDEIGYGRDEGVEKRCDERCG